MKYLFFYVGAIGKENYKTSDPFKKLSADKLLTFFEGIKKIYPFDNLMMETDYKDILLNHQRYKKYLPTINIYPAYNEDNIKNLLTAWDKIEYCVSLAEPLMAGNYMSLPAIDAKVEKVCGDLNIPVSHMSYDDFRIKTPFNGAKTEELKDFFRKILQDPPPKYDNSWTSHDIEQSDNISGTIWDFSRYGVTSNYDYSTSNYDYSTDINNTELWEKLQKGQKTLTVH